MGDHWAELPPPYGRGGYSTQDGTLMDLGRQLMQRLPGEQLWSNGGLENWQSQRQNCLVGEQNYPMQQDVTTCQYDGELLSGGGPNPLSDMTNPRQYQIGGIKQQVREPQYCYTGVQNVPSAKLRGLGTGVLDNSLPSRDLRYGLDFPMTGDLRGGTDIKYQLQHELEFQAAEAEKGVWRNNFGAMPQGRMTNNLNSMVSMAETVSNLYTSSVTSTPLNCTIPSRHKPEIGYASRLSPALNVNSDIATEQYPIQKYASRISREVVINEDAAIQSHTGMMHGSRMAEMAPSSGYGRGESTFSPVSLNSSLASQHKSHSGIGYSERMTELSNGFGSGEVVDDLGSGVPTLETYELQDFHSAAFVYSTPVFEERVATNDSTSEPMDCLMGDFHSDVVPDAMSPAINPILKRTNWEMVNDGFDLLSHGPCPETTGGFRWQPESLLSDIRHPITSSFLLQTTPKPTVGVEQSRSCPAVLNDESMQEYPLAHNVQSIPSNHISNALREPLQETNGGEVPTVSNVQAVKEEPHITSKGKEDYRVDGKKPTAFVEGERGTVDKMDRSSRMMDRVMRFAEVIEAKDEKVGAVQLNSALVALQEMCSINGDYTQRVAHYFQEALAQRLAKQKNLTMVIEEPYQLPHDLLEDCQFTEACPYTKFVHLTANQALLESVEGAERVHIVDIGTMQGVQWSALLQALVSPAGPKAAPPPKGIRITGIASPKLGSSASESLHKTGRRLMEFAEVFGVKIEFHSVVEDVQKLDRASLGICDGEVLAVNLMLQLHQYSGEDGGEGVNKVLKFVEGLKPKVVVLVEYEAGVNTDTVDSQTRLLDALKHYCAVFQTLECIPQGADRSRIEKDILGREIKTMFSSPRTRGAMQHFSFEQWKNLLKASGFQAAKPSHYSFSQGRLLLWMYDDNYQILNNPESIALSWHDRVLVTVSAWHSS